MIVTEVPPEAGPEVGETPVIVGGARGMIVAPDAAQLPVDATRAVPSGVMASPPIAPTPGPRASSDVVTNWAKSISSTDAPVRKYASVPDGLTAERDAAIVDPPQNGPRGATEGEHLDRVADDNCPTIAVQRYGREHPADRGVGRRPCAEMVNRDRAGRTAPKDNRSCRVVRAPCDPRIVSRPAVRPKA